MDMREVLAAWRTQIERDRKQKIFRPTVHVILSAMVNSVPYVPLVLSHNGERRMKENSGKPAFTFPKGGVDGKDDCCPLRASIREMQEETGIALRPECLVGTLNEPAAVPEKDPLDLSRLRKKGYKKGKRHFALHFKIGEPLDALPRTTLQEEEIVAIEWVKSLGELCQLTVGTPIQPYMLKVAREAKLWQE